MQYMTDEEMEIAWWPMGAVCFEIEVCPYDKIGNMNFEFDRQPL